MRNNTVQIYLRQNGVACQYWIDMRLSTSVLATNQVYSL